MHFHYALVDDLISNEDFEQRVEEKIEECGDLIDEPTAAMLVVGDLGRAHVKIKGVSGKSSLFSFFGKVLDKNEIKEFVRADGERGAVATLLLGDDTGTVRVVLWDERAGAVEEINIDDVLEIIGRHSGKNSKEIYALVLRKANCQIECKITPNGIERLNTESIDLDVRILFVEEPRVYVRQDGTSGEMVEAVVGDKSGTARIVAWVPSLFRNLFPGTSVHITSAKPNERGEGRTYSIDEKSSITTIEQEIEIPFTPISAIIEGNIYSVQGTVKRVQKPRSFKSRDGSPSWVRNIVITDEKDDLHIVIWGGKALSTIQNGEHVKLFHGIAKKRRFGGIELQAGRGSALVLPEAQSSEVIVYGTVIIHQGIKCIDNGHKCYYLEESDLPLWHEVRVEGMVSGDKIQITNWEPIHISSDSICQKAKNLRVKLNT